MSIKDAIESKFGPKRAKYGPVEVNSHTDVQSETPYTRLLTRILTLQACAPVTDDNVHEATKMLDKWILDYAYQGLKAEVYSIIATELEYIDFDVVRRILNKLDKTFQEYT